MTEINDMNVTLSDQPDEMGLYYGYAEGDPRRVDVKQDGRYWHAFVDGVELAGNWQSRARARIAAEDWMALNITAPNYFRKAVGK